MQLRQLQRLQDVALHLRCGRGSECQNRRFLQFGYVTAEIAVLGPEIVPPLADTMRLVDDEQGDVDVLEQIAETRRFKSLWCHKDKFVSTRFDTSDAEIHFLH